MNPRPFAHLPTEEVEKIRDDPGQKGFKPQLDAIVELEQRKIQSDLQKMQSDIQQLTKPHWSLVPIFWITFASLLIAILAYFRPPQPASPNREHTISSSPATTMMQNSQPTSTQKKQVSQHKPVPKKP